MKRVTGIGGISFQARDARALRAWYQQHLGIDVQDWGGTVFRAADGDSTTWNISPAGNDSYGPSAAPFMVNYRVDNLDALLDALRDEGCHVIGSEASVYGKFGWVLDPEGNKVELWQPPGDA
ncbi:VOC family protein [Massilia sp. YMA4]|uniref:VOC family protein n=1 Tax=Massilia sp. YMA4 TaxID=1593482 RepID=UPI000DD187A9|nr:VOC family protein [Massilia sp. YMA4]AXA90682.1 VOC family protein [Massilia sp. YMA4]